MSSVLSLPASESARSGLARAPRARNVLLDRVDDRVVYYEGERIYFRPLDVEDEPLLRRWINNPAVWQYLPLRGPLNSVREREFVEGQGKTAGEYVFGVVARTGDRLIGTVGLHRTDPVNRSAMLGVSIGETAWQGRGYGREAIRLILKYAFEELNLNRVGLVVFADNWRAIRTYQKVGFVQEGCSRQAQYRNGCYQDLYHFAILRSEWEACREPNATE